MKTIKSYFSLKFVSFKFTDIVSGKAVNLYVDGCGDRWLKESRWSFFRVKLSRTSISV